MTEGGELHSWSMDDLTLPSQAKTGELIATLDGHNDRVKYVTYSRSGKYVLTATGLLFPNEKDDIVTVCIWNSKTGEFISEFRKHIGGIRWPGSTRTRLSFSPVVMVRSKHAT